MSGGVAGNRMHATIVDAPFMADATLTIDKYAVIQKLEKRGFSQAQAEGIVEALSEINVAQFATTHDLRDLEWRAVRGRHHAGARELAHRDPQDVGIHRLGILTDNQPAKRIARDDTTLKLRNEWAPEWLALYSVQAVQMAAFTVQQGKRYRAEISLGLLERLASNETIAAKLRDAGFSEVRVWGSGGTRHAEVIWPGPDTTAAMPAQIASVFELPAASSPA